MCGKLVYLTVTSLRIKENINKTLKKMFVLWINPEIPVNFGRTAG